MTPDNIKLLIESATVVLIVWIFAKY